MKVHMYVFSSCLSPSLYFYIFNSFVLQCWNTVNSVDMMRFHSNHCW